MSPSRGPGCTSQLEMNSGEGLEAEAERVKKGHLGKACDCHCALSRYSVFRTLQCTWSGTYLVINLSSCPRCAVFSAASASHDQKKTRRQFPFPLSLSQLLPQFQPVVPASHTHSFFLPILPRFPGPLSATSDVHNHNLQTSIHTTASNLSFSPTNPHPQQRLLICDTQPHSTGCLTAPKPIFKTNTAIQH